MAKTKSLDTPFTKGETVITTRDLRGIGSGSEGKVQLSNGLGVWNRYWVRFKDGQLVGQITHEDLVRPNQLDLWHEKKEADRLAAENAANEAEAEAEKPAETVAEPSGGGDDLASRIPADLLERSRAAKARLLG